jgi:catechol 2,3-dioxygenase-like lactoylglutathione lyase family enzyme
MNIHALTPILNVSNLEQSFAWFEKLGWRKLWDYGDPPDFGAISNGGAEIFLCLDGQGCRAGPASAEGGWMSWWVESPAEVDAAYSLALKEKMTVTRPPTNMPWGVRECHIRHPDGHTFRIGAGSGSE